MKKNTKKVAFLVAILIVIGIIIIFNLKKSGQSATKVEVDKAKQDEVVQSINASGTMQPSTQVNLNAKVSAKILAINVKEGEKVKEGRTLVELKSKRYQAAYNRAQASLNSARAKYKRLKSELKRKQKLYQNNHISKSELEQITAQTEGAKGNVQSAQASLEQAQEDLDNTRLNAPMSGTITNVAKEEGEMALGSTYQRDIIMTVSDMSQMEIIVDVDETEIVQVEKGDTAEIELDAFPDTTYQGVVSEIAHSATIEGQGTQEQVTNFEVTIDVLDVDERFKPGMSAMVDIITEVRKNVVSIPIRAVTIRDVSDSLKTKKQEQEVVFKIQRKEGEGGLFGKEEYFQALRQPVKIGISSDTQFEVIKGLSPGDSIITGPYDAISKKLKEGDVVEIGKE